MKTTFLAIIFSLGIISNLRKSTPYLGKWHNVANSSSIKEVSFFPDHQVTFSNQTFSIQQQYSLSSHEGNHNRFTGFFEIINMGKIVKKSSVEMKFLEDDLMELKIDNKKLILKRY